MMVMMMRKSSPERCLKWEENEGKNERASQRNADEISDERQKEERVDEKIMRLELRML